MPFDEKRNQRRKHLLGIIQWLDYHINTIENLYNHLENRYNRNAYSE